MARGFSYKEVKHFIEVESQSGCELISKWYVKNSHPLKIKCKCGSEFEVSLMAFKIGQRQCKKCNGYNDWDYESVKKFIEIESESGCELLSTEYIKNTAKLILKCKCNNEFSLSFVAFKDNNQRQCRKCSKENQIEKSRFSYDKVEGIIKSLGYELIDKDYKGNQYKMHMKDKDGYYFYTTFAKLNSGHFPSKFSINNPYVMQNIRLMLKSKGSYTLIDNSYTDPHQKITTIDDDGYIYYCLLHNIIKDHKPDKCNPSNPYSIQNINLWIKLNNKPFELISKTYRDSNEKLQWRCLKLKCGEMFKSSWAEIAFGNGCGVCHGKQVGLSNCLATINPELAKEWHPNKNGDLTPFDVTANSNKKVWWLCKECGNEWPSRITKRHGAGRGCPECNESKGEKEIDNVLADNNWIKIIQEEYNILSNLDKCSKNYFIPQKTFEDLRGVGNGLLSYDHYLPNINLLIEYQGQYHDGTAGNQSNEEFIIQQEHDFRKKEYALANGYNFLEIWYWDFDNIEEILNRVILKYVTSKQQYSQSQVLLL